MPFFGVPIRNGLPIGLGSVAGFGVQQFDPSQLFAGGTVAGAWYDPSDLSTLFTTSAGTTPVAMPGLGSAVSVGAMLDKRAAGYSVFFDGTGDNLETPNSAAFQFGTGNFTVEGWIYVTGALTGYRIIAQCASNSSWGSGWTLATRDDKLSLWFNASEIASSAVGAIVANTWVHVAATRSGTNVGLWINGSSAATATSSADLQPTRAVSIGAEASPFSFPFQGYISNLRVVKGAAVYTGAFTPSGPLSPIAGTSLLTCGTSWTGNPTITSVGNTRVDGLNPFTASPVGNHAISFNNTTARPELRARVNLLTYSEEFDNGAWAKTAVTVTANTAVAPDGATTADTLTETTALGYHSTYFINTVAAGQSITCSFAIKKNSARYAQINYGGTAAGRWIQCVIDLDTGLITQSSAGAGGTLVSASSAFLGDGWYRVSLTGSVVTDTTTYVYVGTVASSTPSLNTFGVEERVGSTSNSIYIWGADLRPANIGANVPAYQRIADANTYDTSGFPLYLRFDGIDDSMYTPANLNLSGTDKVAVFAGVRKLSDAAVGVIAELSQNSDTNNGSMAIGAASSNGPRYLAQLRGNILGYYEPETYAAPITNIFSVVFDIGSAALADEITPRINGTVNRARPFNGSGAGNFGTYPLYVGARNNSSLRFNGHLHSLIIAGSAVSAGNISATEQWVAQKTGIAI